MPKNKFTRALRPKFFYIFTCLLFWIYLPFIIDEGERFDS